MKLQHSIILLLCDLFRVFEVLLFALALLLGVLQVVVVGLGRETHGFDTEKKEGLKKLEVAIISDTTSAQLQHNFKHNFNTTSSKPVVMDIEAEADPLVVGLEGLVGAVHIGTVVTLHVTVTMVDGSLDNTIVDRLNKIKS